MQRAVLTIKLAQKQNKTKHLPTKECMTLIWFITGVPSLVPTIVQLSYWEIMVPSNGHKLCQGIKTNHKVIFCEL